MIRLRKRAPATRVPLGKDAWIDVRPATQFEVEEAFAKVKNSMAGIADGSAAAIVLASILGDDFNVGDLAVKTKFDTASDRLAEIYVVLSCQSGWAGVGDEEGNVFAAPDAATIALLLNDSMIRQRIMKVVNAGVHLETAEGNGLPASQSGGAGTPDGAPGAGPMATPVQTGDVSQAKPTLN